MRTFFMTGFITSALSYAVFAFLDYLHPGFVSNVFSVHVFLLAAIVFGIGVHFSSDRTESEPGVRMSVFALLLGLLFAIVVWREGGIFGDVHYALAVGAFFLPGLVFFTVSRTTK